MQRHRTAWRQGAQSSHNTDQPKVSNQREHTCTFSSMQTLTAPPNIPILHAATAVFGVQSPRFSVNSLKKRRVSSSGRQESVHLHMLGKGKAAVLTVIITDAERQQLCQQH